MTRGVLKRIAHAYQYTSIASGDTSNWKCDDDDDDDDDDDVCDDDDDDDDDDNDDDDEIIPNVNTLSKNKKHNACIAYAKMQTL